LCAVVEELLDGSTAANSTSDLDLDIGDSEDSLNFRGSVSASRDRVEIHYVEILEAVLSPCDRDSNRVGNANQLLIGWSSGELDARASTQIKRGNCDHRATDGMRAWIMRGEGAVLIACRRACE
jgi:hypothetical protein